MSLISGLPFIYIPFSLGQQPNGAWAGNNIVFTTLKRGRYFISWNPRVLPFLGGADTINSFQFAICSNAPFGVLGSIMMAGLFGVSETGEGPADTTPAGAEAPW